MGVERVQQLTPCPYLSAQNCFMSLHPLYSPQTVRRAYGSQFSLTCRISLPAPQAQKPSDACYSFCMRNAATIHRGTILTYSQTRRGVHAVQHENPNLDPLQAFLAFAHDFAGDQVHAFTILGEGAACVSRTDQRYFARQSCSCSQRVGGEQPAGFPIRLNTSRDP